jgi:hypothetical protein
MSYPNKNKINEQQRNDKGSRKDETKAFKGKALERPETATCRPHDNSFRERQEIT